MNESAVNWLLLQEDPSLQLRVRTELLCHPQDDPGVQAALRSIPGSPAVTGLFARMHPDGYWLQKDYKGRVFGDGERYADFGTTHFILSYLSELGMDRNDPRIEKAANRYLDLQLEDGSWGGHMSCRYAYNIRTFVRLGYRDDVRVQKTIELMLSTPRTDGGYLCDMHEGKYKTRETKSCVRGCSKALLAFSELPETWQHPRCRQLVVYFLDHHGIFSTNNPSEPINKDSSALVYPIHWRASLWEPLYALSRMGYGRHPALQRAWETLESRLDAQGRAPLDFSPNSAPWKVGKRGEPNPWITLYVLLAQQYRDQVPPAF
ncbi:MAG: terpene cyclase/mutase family protein [Anaerolineae bacterium]|nr:terpene cyclase/mutase family protein [Anaerolineae bacterium]